MSEKRQKREFMTYIHRVLKTIDSESYIKHHTCEQLNEFLIIIIDKLAILATQNNYDKITVSQKEIQHATMILLPEDLANNCIEKAAKAIVKANESEEFKEEFKSAETRQYRAGIIFPVARCEKYIRRYAIRVSYMAPVFIAAVLEYLCYLILELAVNITKEYKLKIIKIRHMFFAIQNHKELNTLTKSLNIEFSNAGVVPYIHDELITKSVKDIKKYQNSTKLLLQKSPFQRNFREIAGQYYEDPRFNDGVIIMIQEFIELRLVKIFQTAVNRTIAARRRGVIVDDINYAVDTVLSSQLCNDKKFEGTEKIPESSLRHISHRAGATRIVAGVYPRIDDVVVMIMGGIAKFMALEMELKGVKTVSKKMLKSIFLNCGYNYIV
jgi:histone H2A